jgi:hypothetical protein
MVEGGPMMPDAVLERPGWWGRRWIVCTRRASWPGGFEGSYGCSGDLRFWTRRGAEEERKLRVLRETETTGEVRHTVTHR